MPSPPTVTPSSLWAVLAGLAAIGALVVAGLMAWSPVAPPPTRSAAEQAAEAVLFEQHQQARQGTASSLRWADDMAAVARTWSDEMARSGRLGHNPRYADQVCCWQRVAENVAYVGPVRVIGSPEAAARRLFQRWMESEGHRSSILRREHDHIGIGVRIDGDDRMWATAVFRQSRSDAPATRSTYVTLNPDPPPLRSLEHSCPSDAVTAASFTDVGRYQREIDCAAWWSLSTGREDGSYAPDEPVTRAQMASFLYRKIEASSAPLPATGPDRFTDVSGVHADAIAALAQAGVITGYADGTFRPNAPVTRGQMATFLERTWTLVDGGVPADPAAPRFADTYSSVHRGAIERVVEAGWAGGYGGGVYRPDQHVRRDHLALFLTRWLDSAVEAGQATPPR
jgi:uncharacterized protein YkwD